MHTPGSLISFLTTTSSSASWALHVTTYDKQIHTMWLVAGRKKYPRDVPAGGLFPLTKTRGTALEQHL